MDFAWQNITALALVLAAAAYVVRRFRRMAAVGRRTGCPTCAECPRAPDRKGPPPTGPVQK